MNLTKNVYFLAAAVFMSFSGLISPGVAHGETFTENSAERSWSLGLDLEMSQSSDQIQIQKERVFIIQDRFDLSYPYSQERSEQWEKSVDIFSHQDSLSGVNTNILGGLLRIRKKTAGRSFGASVGGAQVTYQGANQSKLIGGLSAEAAMDEGQLYMRGNFAQTLAAEVPGVVSRIDPAISASNLVASATWYPSLQYQLRVTGTESWYSDGNIRNFEGGELLYALERERHWMWLGLGADQSGYITKSPGYWSPAYLVTYGLRWDATYVASSSISFGTGGAWGWVKEESNPTGVGHYISTFLQFGKRGFTTLRLGYFDQLSLQSSATWSNYGAVINFSSSL